jgi:hypothetical protein
MLLIPLVLLAVLIPPFGGSNPSAPASSFEHGSRLFLSKNQAFGFAVDVAAVAGRVRRHLLGSPTISWTWGPSVRHADPTKRSA